jgi:hypothetical protein
MVVVIDRWLLAQVWLYIVSFLLHNFLYSRSSKNSNLSIHFFQTQVRASFFEEIVAKVGLNNENITLDNEMGESHQLCEDMFIFSKVFPQNKIV